MMPWQGKTPHRVFIRYYALCGLFFWLIFPLFLAWKKYRHIEHTVYYLDDSGVGVENQFYPDANRFLDIDRIKEIEIAPFLMGKLKKIQFHTANKYIPPILFHAVPIPEDVIEQFKQKMAEIHTKKKVNMVSLPILQ